MMGASAPNSDGELLRMPAEFLIEAQGVIGRAHDAAFGEDVLAWASRA